MENVEWDSLKRESNLAKHGIDFVGVVELFDDPSLLEKPDTRHDYGEQRIQAMGRVRDQVLFVVYTWRDGKRRLISARNANREERQIYEAHATPA
ncbi:MAG: BrnT family toxin [Alphaproteobacteria bacterium]|nr:BrnT family toxin [Alphaproteobacteria bacterium]